MDIEVFGHGLVDALEKTKKLLMPVPALGEYHAGGISSAANSVVVP
jgi:hypothetical protein